MNTRRRKKLQQRLMDAAGWADAKQVGAVLRAGADPNVTDRDGSTPLYRASVQNMANNVRVLLAAGADPNVESGTGEEGLPLCGAACWGHHATVRELLAGGADPYLREDDGHGHTAVEWARIGGHSSTLEMLLAAAVPHSRTPSMPLPERREFGADRTNEAVSCRRCLSYGNFEVNGSYVVWDPFKDWGNVQTGDYVGLKVCLVDGANDPTASHCDSATVRSSDG